MRVVYKYPLEIGVTTFPLPVNAVLLSVHEQYGQLVLYAEVDPDEMFVPIVIQIIGTGHRLPMMNLDYISTVMADNGLVWHVYKEV